MESRAAAHAAVVSASTGDNGGVVEGRRKDEGQRLAGQAI